MAVAVTLVFAATTIFAVHDDGLFELGTPPYGAGSGDIAGSAFKPPQFEPQKRQMACPASEN